MRSDFTASFAALIILPFVTAAGAFAGVENAVANGSFEAVNERGWAVGWTRWPGQRSFSPGAG